MDSKITGGLAPDNGAEVLYKADGSYKDDSAKSRYVKGF